MRTRIQLLVGLSIAAVIAGALAIQPPRLARAQSDIGLSNVLLELEAIYGSGYTGGATRVNATSGNVAAATATATIPAVALKMNYLTGWDVNGSGATAALVVDCTVTGLAGGTEHRTFAAVAGVTTLLTPLQVRYPTPMPASAVNTAIVASCPTLGSGNTNTTVNAYGFTANN